VKRAAGARPGDPQVVVLSDGLWRTRCGADPDIVGHTVEMSGLSRTVLGVMPPDFGHPDRTARFEGLKESLAGDVTTTLWILLGPVGPVGFVLLIACANVANLLRVRAEGRQRELALRSAIGAGRFPILRVESTEPADRLRDGGGGRGGTGSRERHRLRKGLAGPRTIDAIVRDATARTSFAVAAVASWLPALRAASVDPSIALRAE